MQLSIQKELHALLGSLGVPLLYVDSGIMAHLRESCSSVRDRLLAEEREPGSMREQSFWDLSPKYHLDILLVDIQILANSLAYAIGFAAMFRASAEQAIKIPHQQEGGDVVFWYHVDFGVRLASSGWDRIAIMLNLTFDLNLDGRGCTLPAVLQQLPKQVPELERNPHFKSLKTFRDSKHSELQSRRAGAGVRDETAHLMTLYSRQMFEFYEAAGNHEQLTSLRSRPQDWLNFLREHHSLYLKGIDHTGHLIQSA